MFDRLDAALASLLHDAAMPPALAELLAADISFVTPHKTYAPSQETVNLFLFETVENRALRDVVPIEDRRNGVSIRRRPPVRVDCSYLVTTWSKKTGAVKVSAEHQLLGEAFQWLSRFPVIPPMHLQAAGLADQAFPPPTLVAQMDAARHPGEFWLALGIAPRPYFSLVATIALDLLTSTEAALVTTATTSYHPSLGTGTADTRIIIGGTVFDPQGTPVSDAWVRLEPRGDTTVTDELGRFVFADVRADVTYTLRARAVGFGEAASSNIDVVTHSGGYDVHF